MSVFEPTVEIIIHMCYEPLTFGQMHFKKALWKIIKHLSAVINVSVLKKQFDDDEIAEAYFKNLIKQILHLQHRIQHVLKKRKELQRHHFVNIFFIDAKNVRLCCWRFNTGL